MRDDSKKEREEDQKAALRKKDAPPERTNWAASPHGLLDDQRRKRVSISEKNAREERSRRGKGRPEIHPEGAASPNKKMRACPGRVDLARP